MLGDRAGPVVARAACSAPSREVDEQRRKEHLRRVGFVQYGPNIIGSINCMPAPLRQDASRKANHNRSKQAFASIAAHLSSVMLSI
jgi:hypothetical protein